MLTILHLEMRLSINIDVHDSVALIVIGAIVYEVTRVLQKRLHHSLVMFQRARKDF